MIEQIKSKIWNSLKEKKVSLAMLYSTSGEILWHRGRSIDGRDVIKGEGFSKTYIHQSLTEKQVIQMNDVLQQDDMPHSAKILALKSLLIIPIRNEFFLYVDSGTKEYFNDTEIEVLKVLGDLLGETIDKAAKNGRSKGGITGESAIIEQIRNVVIKYSLEEEPILLLGETGAGKSHIAELVHRFSSRQGAFVTVNTPAIPEHLFESTIFGHKKGSFTDAKSDKPGFIAEAQGGTLFLDEVSEIPLTFQAKLLRFIETRKYVVLGDTKEIDADVRIIAATNKDLSQAIKDKEMRSDLYFRLHILEIEIPPLRERRNDIKALILEHKKLLRGKEIAEGFWDVMQGYDWPGNVRELLTILTRAGILLESPLTGKEMREMLNRSSFQGLQPQRTDTMAEVLEAIDSGQDFWQTAWAMFIEREICKEDLREFIRDLYLRSQHSLKEVAGQLNIAEEQYKRFVTILHRYDLHPGK